MRAKPFCAVFGVCGGCQVQHLAYPAQLAWKEQIVRSALRRIGGFANADVRRPVGMTNPRNYRNKMALVVDRPPSGETSFGFYQARSHALVRIDSCPVVLPQLDAAIGGLYDAARAARRARRVRRREARDRARRRRVGPSGAVDHDRPPVVGGQGARARARAARARRRRHLELVRAAHGQRGARPQDDVRVGPARDGRDDRRRALPRVARVVLSGEQRDGRAHLPVSRARARAEPQRRGSVLRRGHVRDLLRVARRARRRRRGEPRRGARGARERGAQRRGEPRALRRGPRRGRDRSQRRKKSARRSRHRVPGPAAQGQRRSDARRDRARPAWRTCGTCRAIPRRSRAISPISRSAVMRWASCSRSTCSRRRATSRRWRRLHKAGVDAVELPEREATPWDDRIPEWPSDDPYAKTEYPDFVEQ